MWQWGKRESAAAMALLSVGAVGIFGWTMAHSASSAEGLRPVAADGAPAQQLTPDDVAEAEAQAPESPTATVKENPHPAKSSAKPEKIVVFVSGAVKRPGVYTFHTGDRIYAAIKAAGGLKETAQADTLNQADFLQDADQIHVPSKVTAAASAPAAQAAAPARPAVISGGAPPGATPAKTTRKRGRVLGQSPAVAPRPAPVRAPAAPETAPARDLAASESAPATDTKEKKSGSNKLKTAADGMVNINTATLEELQRLPGIGPSTAQKFLDYRQQIGKFASIEQVQDIKGIGPKKFEKLRDVITVDQPTRLTD